DRGHAPRPRPPLQAALPARQGRQVGSYQGAAGLTPEPPARHLRPEDGPSESTTEAEPEADEKEEAGKPRPFWREVPGLLLTALIIAVLIKTFLVQPFYIPSDRKSTRLNSSHVKISYAVFCL